VAHSFLFGLPRGRGTAFLLGREVAHSRSRGENICVTVVVKPRADNPTMGGWHFGLSGHTPREGTSRATYKILHDLLDRFPREIATAMPGVFPRGDIFNPKWD
jgi:hypothetical protein